MKREDAIKRFQLMKKILSIPNCDAARTTEAIDMAVEALEREPRGEWIPVSEKLPREGQKCLVCHKGGIGIDEFIGHDLPYKWRIYLRDYDAWMPLPEPYKESDAK